MFSPRSPLGSRVVPFSYSSTTPRICAVASLLLVCALVTTAAAGPSLNIPTAQQDSAPPSSDKEDSDRRENKEAHVDKDRKDATRGRVQVDAQGLHVSSADGRHNLHLTPFIQFAHHHMLTDSPDGMASGTRIEHFRPILAGQYNEILDYIFILQITADDVSLLYGFINLRPHERVQLRVGLQNPIFAIEMRQFQQAMLFINRSMDSSIGVVCDLGVALDLRPIDPLQFEIGVYNGTDDHHVFSGIQEKSISGEIGARWYAVGQDAPSADIPGFLTFGTAAVLRRSDADAQNPHLTPHVSPGQHVFMNYADGVYAEGRTLATTVFAHAGYKGLYAEGKFTTSNQQVRHANGQGRVVKHAWLASLAYTLGGSTGWSGTTVQRSVFDGGLGALQFKFRGHGLAAHARGGPFLEVENTPANALSANGLSAGVSWFLVDGLRIQADYNWTRFHADHNALDHRREHLLSLGITAGY